MEILDSLIWIDWVIVAVALISAVWGIIRGMVREAISLATWVSAIMLGRLFGPQVSEMLVNYIEQDMVRNSIAFVAVAVLVMMVGSLLSSTANKVVSATGFSGVNRFLGLIFGAMRGVAILIILIAVISLTPLAGEPWWSESQFIPVLEQLRDQAAGMLDNRLNSQ